MGLDPPGPPQDHHFLPALPLDSEIKVFNDPWPLKPQIGYLTNLIDPRFLITSMLAGSTVSMAGWVR